MWGVAGESLREARDPTRVAAILSQSGLSAAPVRPESKGLPRDGSWLQKPLASAGGRKIAPWVSDSIELGEPHYFQERIRGGNLSAVYLAQAGEVELVGVTVQILGRGGSPFGYRGSCGPIRLAPAVRDRFMKVGEALHSELGLTGLFGVDVVLRGGEPWVVEINPRYSASVEVLELAMGRSILAGHIRAFGGLISGSSTIEIEKTLAPVVGKLIVDSPGSFVFEDWPIPAPSDLWTVPEVADVPRPGTVFRAGEPVLTVFAKGADEVDCLARLHRHWQEWRNRLRAHVRPSRQEVSPK